MENLIKNKTGENNMTLTLTNLTKQYGNFTALENFTYDFTAGVYGVLGPKGAGKSTLIKISTHKLNPPSGSVKFDALKQAQWTPTSAKFSALCPNNKGFIQTLRWSVFSTIWLPSKA